MQSFAPRYDSSRLATASLEPSRYEHAPPASFAHVHAGPQGVAFVASSSSQPLVSSTSSMPPSISSWAKSDGDNCLVPDLDRLRKLKAVVLTGDHPEYTAIIKPHALKAVSVSLAEAAAQYEAAGGVILAENGQGSQSIPESPGPSALSAEDTLVKSIKRSSELNTEEDREDARVKRIKMEEPEPSLSIPHHARSNILEAQTSIPTSSGPTGSPSLSHVIPKYPSSSSLNLASRVEPTSAPPDRRGSLSISEPSSSGPSTRPDSRLPAASDVGSQSRNESKRPITHIWPDTYRPQREGTSPPRAIYNPKREPDSGAESSWLRSERGDHSSHADKDRRRARERDDERAHDREAYLERVHRDREEAARQREEEDWERRQREHSQGRTYDPLGRTEPNAPPRWLGPRDAIDARFPPRSSVPPPFSGHPPPPPSASYSRASMAVYPSAAGPPPPSLHDNYVAAPYSALPPLHATLYDRHGPIPGMPPFGNNSAGGGPPLLLPRDTYGRPSAPGPGSYRSDDPHPYRPDSASPFPSHPSFYQRGGGSPPPPPPLPSFARQNDIYREMQALQEKMAVLQKQAAQFDGGEGGPRGGGGPGPYGRPPPNPTPSMQAPTPPSTHPLQCPPGSGPASYVRGQPPFRPVPPPPQASYGHNNDDSPPSLPRSGLGSALPPPAGYRSQPNAYERAGTPGGGGGYGGPLPPPPPGGADYSPRGEGGRCDDERGYNRPRKMMDQAGGGGGRWDVGRDRDWSRR